MALKKNLAASRMDPPSPGEPLNRESFELFFRENFLRFCLLCQFKFGFDTDQAKEIVHVSFVKLWESRAGMKTAIINAVSAEAASPLQEVEDACYLILTSSYYNVWH